MAVINVELPLLIFAVALMCATLAWFFGTFTRFLRACRYRVVMGTIAFALSGLMGFFCALKVELNFFGDWFSEHPVSALLGIAYFAYVLCGFLGRWTAMRLATQLDRKHTLAVLYSVWENRKMLDEDQHSHNLK